MKFSPEYFAKIVPFIICFYKFYINLKENNLILSNFIFFNKKKKF